MTQRPSRSAAPPAIDNADVQSAATPRDQVIQQIRFGLETLSSQNGHHTFEHLCRHFARERIAPNILPATGPVSAGGDRGRDFETFRSFLREEVGPYGAFAGALNDGGAIAFLCTLQRDDAARKIRIDIEKVMGAGAPVKHIYAFLGGPLAKGKRDALQDEVRARHSVELELLDREALAEALADPEIFWIAEQYLSIPASVRPAISESGPELPAWYVADRARWRRRGTVNPQMGELLDVLDGLRQATFDPRARADLPFWLELVRALDHPDTPRDVRQRARYEVAASHARGTGTLRPVDEVALEFLRETVSSEEDPARLHDAASLLLYACAAAAQGRSDLEPADLVAVNVALRERLRAMLAQDPPPIRRAHLLEVLGQLAIMSAIPPADVHGDGADLQEIVAMIDQARDEGEASPVALESWRPLDIDEAMRAWGELASMLEDTPLYPVDGWAQVLDFLSPVLMRHDGWEQIEHAVDDALQRSRGGEIAAERAHARAERLVGEGRLLDALRELHQAADRWWSGDSLESALRCMLTISRIYLKLRLPQAAKQYALAAATGAAGGTNDDIVSLVPHAILAASEIDYAAGAWASAVEHVDVGLFGQTQLVDPEVDEWAVEDTARALLTLGMALRAAEQLAPEALPMVQDVANRYGLLSTLQTELAGAASWDEQEWKDVSDEQLQGRPFSDLGAERTFRFAALGTTWTIRSSSAYRDARTAERLAAAAQIVLAALARDDLALLPAEIDVHVVADAGTPAARRVTRATAGDSPSWRVSLTPLEPGQSFDTQAHFTETLSSLVVILSDISLLPGREALDRVTAAFEHGLGGKIARGRPFEELAEIVPRARYERTRRGLAVPLDVGRPPASAHPDLAGPTTPGPTYTPEKACEAITRRYERIPRQIEPTLERLRSDQQFQTVVAELRAHSWRDWHILTAVMTIVGNARIARDHPDAATMAQTPTGPQRLQQTFLRREVPGDPPVPASQFVVEAMRFALRVCLPSYIAGWDLQMKGGWDPEATEEFLAARYRYWDDDVPHANPFAKP